MTRATPNERVSYLVRHPWQVLLAFALTAAALGSQAPRFRVDASADTLLSDDNRHYLETLRVERVFAPQEFLLVAYAPHSGVVLSPATLQVVREMSRELARLERVESVRSILNVPLFSLAKGGLGSELDPAQLTLEQAEVDPATLRAELTTHPIYQGLLVNAELSVTALQLLFRPYAPLGPMQEQIEEIRLRQLERPLSDAERRQLEELREQAEPLERELQQQRYEEIRRVRAITREYAGGGDIYIGGAHALGYQLVQIIKSDLRIFGSAIALMICAVLWLVFRDWRWVLIPLLSCGLSVLSTVGLFALLGWKATVISANFIALQLILNLAIVVHLIVRYLEEQAHAPQAPQAQLVEATLRDKLMPCIYAGLTTSVGFASLLLSGIAPVEVFGRMMIAALLVSVLSSLLLFPALLQLFGKPARGRKGGGVRALLDGLAPASRRSRVLVVLLGVGLLVGSIAGALRLDVENSFINYFAPSTEVHRELSFIDQELGGTTPLDLSYTIPAAERQAEPVLAAETLRRLQLLQHRLADEPAVGQMLSVVNFAQLAKQLNDDRPLTEYEMTALYWLLDASLREELLGSFFDPDSGQLRLSIRIQDATPDLNRAELLQRLRVDLEQLGFAEESYSLSNLFVLYQDLLQRLFRSQILTLGLVYLVLGLTFWVIFRSLKLSAIALAPNVLSTLAILGLMGALAIPLDFMTITIAAIAMGIAVDSTIHYIHRYRQELERHPPEQAMRLSQRNVGRAIVYTSVIVALGFALLAFSDFVPSMLFGLLTALAMLLALLANLTLLPALLLGLRRAPAQAG